MSDTCDDAVLEHNEAVDDQADLPGNAHCVGDCFDPDACTCPTPNELANQLHDTRRENHDLRNRAEKAEELVRQFVADPVQVVLCHPRTPEGRAQLRQITDVMQRTDQECNADTGDDALDRDYLQTLAEPVLNTLRTEPPTLTTHPDHEWMTRRCDEADNQ